MNAPRTLGSRARRIAAATAGLGLATIAIAPAASAASYPPSGDGGKPATQVLGTKSSAAPVKHAKASRDSLAYTGAEVGAFGAAGLGLVVGGALLVRAGRRSSGTAAA